MPPRRRRCCRRRGCWRWCWCWSVRPVVVAGTTAARTVVVGTVVVRSVGVVGVGGQGWLAVLVAVGGVAVGEVGLGPADERCDAELVEGAGVAGGFGGAGVRVCGGPDHVRLLGWQLREQFGHPVAVVGADQRDVALLVSAAFVGAVGVDPVDPAADRVAVLGGGAA